MTRRLLFMTDYGADPLWDLRNESMVNLDQLQIPTAARQAIRTWADRWEELAWQEMSADELEAGRADGPATPVPPGAWEQLDRDGRLLWLDLQQDLGSDYQVGWVSFSDGTRHVQWEPEGTPEPCPPGSGSS